MSGVMSAGPRKTHPGAMHLWLQKYHAEFCPEAVVNDKLAAHNTMRLCVPTTLERPGLPKQRISL
jgi:hypothetical protein